MVERIDGGERPNGVLQRDPQENAFLRSIAAPASYIASWWGGEESPTIFFPFAALQGGFGQFIVGFYGYAAGDVLVTVMHFLWGSFWMSVGLLDLLVATGALPPHPLHEQFPELTSWFIVLSFLTWSGAIASARRDLIRRGALTALAIGSTIAWYIFAYMGPVGTRPKVAAYFWIIGSILAWWRVTVYLMEGA